MAGSRLKGYLKAVEKWLRHRERNPRMLEGLVRAGFRTTVMKLARKVGYKPESGAFFEILRWKQKQSAGGHRTLALDTEVSAAESWDGLSEAQICARIVEGRPSWKRLVGLLPTAPGLTSAIAAAAVESGALSDTDLVVLPPTLEDLGLLKVPVIKARWEAAVQATESLRAANIAKRVRSSAVADTLQEGADQAVKKALEEVTRDLRVYVIVDKSGSMEGAIERAKAYLSTFLQGFPLERTHVSIFNTRGTEVRIRQASSVGVGFAFRGHKAGGGTDYGAGVRALAQHEPQASEDAVMIFVGDQADNSTDFTQAIVASGINPVAFGLLEVVGSWGWKGTAVEDTASILGIPCFKVDEDMFSDACAVPRVLRNLVASIPVGARGGAVRQDLVAEILATPLLEKPVWA